MCFIELVISVGVRGLSMFSPTTQTDWKKEISRQAKWLKTPKGTAWRRSYQKGMRKLRKLVVNDKEMFYRYTNEIIRLDFENENNNKKIAWLREQRGKLSLLEGQE